MFGVEWISVRIDMDDMILLYYHVLDFVPRVSFPTIQLSPSSQQIKSRFGNCAFLFAILLVTTNCKGQSFGSFRCQPGNPKKPNPFPVVAHLFHPCLFLFRSPFIGCDFVQRNGGNIHYLFTSHWTRR